MGCSASQFRCLLDESEPDYQNRIDMETSTGFTLNLGTYINSITTETKSLVINNNNKVKKLIHKRKINQKEIDSSHFDIEKDDILGIGGFGLVRVCTKVSGSNRGEKYAIKSINKSIILKRSTGVKSVMAELNALIRGIYLSIYLIFNLIINLIINLYHTHQLVVDIPFICRLRYAFQDNTHLFMVIDLCTGGDIRQTLKKFPQCRFPEELARFYICQIVIGLNHCHNASILHRDIKPENILIKESGIYLLINLSMYLSIY
jgi:hypothetical protein